MSKKSSLALKIPHDRKLLEKLGMSYRDAAEYLGKTRQTINAMLGPINDDGPAPTDYFRPSDIFILVSAAMRNGVQFDREAVLEYVQATRGQGKPGRDFEALVDLLKPAKTFDNSEVVAAIYILPSFSEMRDSMPTQKERFADEVAEFKRSGRGVELFCVSTTEVLARITGRSIGIDSDERCVGNHIVDHYQPMALYYIPGQERPACRILTEQGLFDVAHFRTEMIQGCVEGLLSKTQREDIKRAMTESSEDASDSNGLHPA